MQRALAPYRRELLAEARATVRFETAPGRQLQIDFGERLVEIGGRKVKVFLFVATLGYSRRVHVRAFRHERQESWFDGLESAFLAFGGVPEEVLFDNARALVADHDAETRTVVFNARLLAFARHWGFRPRACAPYRARTQGKTESGVGYVKRNAVAGRAFAGWDAFETGPYFAMGVPRSRKTAWRAWTSGPTRPCSLDAALPLGSRLGLIGMRSS